MCNSNCGWIGPTISVALRSIVFHSVESVNWATDVVCTHGHLAHAIMHVEGMLYGAILSSCNPNLITLDGTTSLSLETEDSIFEDPLADHLSARAGVCPMYHKVDYAMLDDA